MTATRLQDWPTVCTTPRHQQAIAYRQITVTGTAQTLQALLTAATNAVGAAFPYTLSPDELERTALVTVGGTAINFIDDGQTPTATYGQTLAAASVTTLASQFGQMQLISTGASVAVSITFYR